MAQLRVDPIARFDLTGIAKDPAIAGIPDDRVATLQCPQWAHGLEGAGVFLQAGPPTLDVGLHRRAQAVGQCRLPGGECAESQSRVRGLQAPLKSFNALALPGQPRLAGVDEPLLELVEPLGPLTKLASGMLAPQAALQALKMLAVKRELPGEGLSQPQCSGAKVLGNGRAIRG